MNLLNTYFLGIWSNAASINNRMLSSYVEPAKSVKVLDLGCGNGDIAKQRILGKIRSPKLYGIEIDQHVARAARKNGLQVLVRDVEKRLPYPNNTFDVVSANQLIEHLVNTDRFLQEIFRVLKPSGYLLLATENLASWHNIAALFMGWHPFSLHASDLINIGNPMRLGKTEDLPLHSRHKKVFTLRSLQDSLQLHGFVVQQVFGAGYYPLPPFLARIFCQIDTNHAAFIGLKARKIK